jgi:hypothetical protein
MTAEEAAAALSLRVTPANVFGLPPLASEETAKTRPLEEFFRPSRGVTPSFGERHYNIEDAANRLYALELNGDTAAFLGRLPYEIGRKIIVKIGHAKEPQNRCNTHNAHLPPASPYRWKVALISEAFEGGGDAKRAEDHLKKHFDSQFESLGGEFFLGDETAMMVEFSKIVRAAVFRAP